MEQEPVPQTPVESPAAVEAAAPTNSTRRLIYAAAFFALLKLAFHLYANRGYGYFRDELYFMACGEHLDFGYVDHAPLVAVYAWLSRALFGDSLSAIRFLPALAGAAKIFLTGLIAIELGGGMAAVIVACLACIAAPLYFAMDNFLSMNAFEPVYWTAVIYFAIRALRRRQPMMWIWAGVFAGLGLENKHSTAFFLLALGAGLLLTPAWRAMREKYFWIGLGTAVLIFLPNLIWQFTHGFPTLELLRNVQRTHKNVVLGPVDFVLQQILVAGPIGILVCAAGLWWLFRHRESEPGSDDRKPVYRWMAYTFVLFFVLMFFMSAKNYYLGPIYPMLFAAGGVWWGARQTWMRNTLCVVMVGVSVAIACLITPILPVETLLKYQQMSPLAIPKTEVAHNGILPQHLGDQFAWPEIVEATAHAYNNLPPTDKVRAGIFAGNYGEAGAIDFFGPKYSLPKAISGHQNYYLWGPRDYSGEVLIILSQNSRWFERNCLGGVEETARVAHPLGMPEERIGIYVCRGLNPPLPEVWPRLKVWN
ncbi:MAG: glycosyltransferase family 39 protein [Bryobacteraceae bacterium]